MSALSHKPISQKMGCEERTDEREGTWHIYTPRKSNGIYFETELDAAFYAANNFVMYKMGRMRKLSTATLYTTVLFNICRILDKGNCRCDPNLIEEEDIRYYLNNANVSENTKKMNVTIFKEMLNFYGNYALKDMGLMWNKCETPNARHLEHEVSKQEHEVSKQKHEMETTHTRI